MIKKIAKKNIDFNNVKLENNNCLVSILINVSKIDSLINLLLELVNSENVEKKLIEEKDLKEMNLKIYDIIKVLNDTYISSIKKYVQEKDEQNVQDLEVKNG